MRKFLVIAFALALVICATAVFAQTTDNTQPRRFGGNTGAGFGGFNASPTAVCAPPSAMMFDRMGSTLNLTEDQKTKLTAALAKSEETLTPLRQKAAQAAQALRAAVVSATYDEAKVAQLVTDAQKADTAVLTAELQTWTQIRSILTAEQMKSLQTMGARNRTGTGQNQRGTRTQQRTPPGQ